MKKLLLIGLLALILTFCACGSRADDGKTDETEKPEYTCSIEIRCDTILNNMDKLAEGKEELIPADGLILKIDSAGFTEGESVFDVMQRELESRKVHFEFVEAKVYKSAYIEGIANLYEFDCGELSGWVYSVNGDFPSYGCALYALKDGDEVKWLYTCDLGADVGAGGIEQNGE
jgi:hypothetical protein